MIRENDIPEKIMGQDIETESAALTSDAVTKTEESVTNDKGCLLYTSDAADE